MITRGRLKRFILLAALFILAACAHKDFYNTASKAYETGDYDTAVYKSVAALQAKPDYPEALALLKNSAPLAFETHSGRADAAERRLDYDAAVAEYAAIEKLAAAINSTKAGIALGDVSVRKGAASQKAAEAHYKTGRDALAVGEAEKDMAKLKTAAIEFRKTQEFVAGYEDSKNLYDRARAGAMIKVAVLPFWNAYFTNYGSMLTDYIVAVAVRRNSEFVEFVTRERVLTAPMEIIASSDGTLSETAAVSLGKALGAHYIVTGKIISASAEPPTRADTGGTRDCKIFESKDKYRMGRASWTTHELKATAFVNSSYQLIEVKTGRIIMADAAQASYEDVARWLEFRGDETCVPWEAKYFPNKKNSVKSTQALLGMSLESVGAKIADDLLAKLN